MNIDLKGKRALVCGSTQGIGASSAKALASLGAEVVLLARNKEKLNEVKASLSTENGQNHDILVADYTQQDQLKKTVHDYTNAGNIIHILINNTGGPPGGPIHLAKTEEFLSALNNHLICNHIIAQSVIEGMKKAGYGRIINIISTSVKQPIPGLGVSNTTRGAVANWSKTLSLELAPFGITVNNLLPGATETQRLSSIIETKAGKLGKEVNEVRDEMLAEIPAGRFAQPDELGEVIAFLASPAAGYMNGINVPVDGGRTACL